MPRFIANPASKLIHAADCDYGWRCMEMEVFDDLTHALRCGYAEAGCCLGERPTVVFERTRLVLAEVKSGVRTCAICERSGRVELAHIVPKRHGGNRRVPLCPNCHQAYDFGELAQHELTALAAYCAKHLGIERHIVRKNHGVGRAEITA